MRTARSWNILLAASIVVVPFLALAGCGNSDQENGTMIKAAASPEESGAKASMDYYRDQQKQKKK